MTTRRRPYATRQRRTILRDGQVSGFVSAQTLHARLQRAGETVGLNGRCPACTGIPLSVAGQQQC